MRLVVYKMEQTEIFSRLCVPHGNTMGRILRIMNCYFGAIFAKDVCRDSSNFPSVYNRTSTISLFKNF